ncbi:MAG: F0F1 ATP synthase subunit B' [Pseudomonadota bacterium]
MSFGTVLLIAAAAASEAQGEAESAGLPQLDMAWWPSQLFWLALTFGVLYFLMAGRFLPALGGAIEERRDRIADDLDQASEFKHQAEEAEAAYNQALADAKAKAQSIAADTRAEVDAEIAAMQAETEDKLSAQLERAEARIAEMKAEASAKVETAAADATKAIVERLIDEAPTDDAIARAVTNIAQ